MSAALHPRLAELLAVVDRSRKNLPATVAAVPVEAAATVPNRGAWSVAEIVEHLLIVEDRIGRTLGQLAKRAVGQLDFYQWLLFIAQHKERHATQIRAMAGRLSDAPTGARR